MREGNVLKVIELGIEKDVYEAMKKPDFSAESLSRKFSTNGITITAQSIRKFIKKTQKAQQELIQKDLRASTEVAKITMDYQNALKDLLDEVQEVKNDAKNERDYATYNQLVGKLLQGIELVAKLTGDIKPKGSIDINILYNEINTDIEKNMKYIRKNIMTDEEDIDIDKDIEKEDKKKKEEIIIEASR